MTALREAHALSLIRLAYVMLGDRLAAEDVVQEAFLGLYQRRTKVQGGVCGAVAPEVKNAGQVPASA